MSTQSSRPARQSILATFFLPVILAVAAATLAVALVPVATGLVYLLTGIRRSVDATQGQGQEFLWRRLEEPPELFGMPLEMPPLLWLFLAWLIFVPSFFLVYWMYVRETRTVGWLWAGLLAMIRSSVILVIFLIWLLPATRMIEWTEQRSRVLMAFDVSGSLQTSDAPPAESPEDIRVTRQEEVLAFLTPPPVDTPNPVGTMAGAGKEPPPVSPRRDFLGRLLEDNPLYCYRYGEQLDVNAWQVARDQLLSPREWARKLQPTAVATLDEPLAAEVLSEWSKAARRLEQLDQNQELALEQRQKDEAVLVADLERALGEQHRLRERLLNRTNHGGALLEILRKETGNMVQGLILFSDGRKNAGSDQELEDAIKEARRAKIPIFTVGIGRSQEIMNLRLVDVIAPGRVQPEDEFPVRVAVEGENVPSQHEVKVILGIVKPDASKEEMQQKVSLASTSARLASGAAEFRISNPQKLKGDWKLTARVEPLKGERTRGDNVTDEVKVVKVEDRKLAVLLASSAASREYQFLRNLLVREQDKFDLTIYLQSAQEGTVQDIPAKKMLEQFPTDLHDRDEDPMNLGNYDVVVAVDLDWRQVPGPSKESQGKSTPQEILKKWVEDFAGGLVVVAGPVHTFHLSREKDLGVIRDLYPVLLDESATAFTIMDRPTKEPWAVNWGPAATQLPFLDLTDSGDKTKFLEGWDEFFDVPRNPENNQADTPAKRGFFSFFPLKDAKPAATVVARFSDPDRQYATPSGVRQPYFVMQTLGKGPVFYIGSPETYRLRNYSEKFHERFWTKLIRQMGKGDQARGSRRGLLVVGSRYMEGDTVEVEAQLYDAEMKPLRIDGRTKVLLKVVPPEGVTDAPRQWADGLEMTPDPARAGWFLTRFPVRRTGKYDLELKIPGSIEKLQSRFKVESLDPERDDTRPNFALLHRLASEAKEIQLNEERRRPEFLQALAQAKERARGQTRDTSLAAKEWTTENDGDRLFFDIETATWIPDCLKGELVPYRTEGRITDLWDKGVTVFLDLDRPEDASGPPWALVFIVALLSLEWLTRKLLKLA